MSAVGSVHADAIEVAAQAAYEAQMVAGDTEWEVFVNVNSSYSDYWRTQARAILQAAAPLIRSQALEDAAEELAKIVYVRPGKPGREEYERLLAIRRGETDRWLIRRAASERNRQ